MSENDKKSSGKTFWLLILGLIVVLAILWWTDNLNIAVGGSNSYQAVFLTNNQVYFGKLVKKNADYPVLQDVYYLQVTQTLQPRDQNAQTTNINLVKLGGEIHGPIDEMVINRAHILFYEDLHENSQVLQAIKQYKENQEEK